MKTLFIKRVLYDLDCNCFFTSDNIPLSLIEFAEKVSSNDYTINYIANDIRCDISNFIDKTGYDYGFIMEKIFADPKGWYKRIMQVPYIRFKGNAYFYNKEDIERVKSYSKSFKYLREREFLRMFYSKNK